MFKFFAIDNFGYLSSISLHLPFTCNLYKIKLAIVVEVYNLTEVWLVIFDLTVGDHLLHIGLVVNELILVTGFFRQN